MDVDVASGRLYIMSIEFFFKPFFFIITCWNFDEPIVSLKKEKKTGFKNGELHIIVNVMYIYRESQQGVC